jgi:hypothetical protein
MTNDKWKMTNDKWKMENGKWKIETETGNGISNSYRF